MLNYWWGKKVKAFRDYNTADLLKRTIIDEVFTFTPHERL
jgi:hypothetical protein